MEDILARLGISDRTGLGKVFISHSSADKPFVRKLVRLLGKHGYDTWLDEKELRAGDTISTEISRAIERAKVVIVVVSEAAISSRWLSYELGLATERMIKNRLRLLPVLIGDVHPPEVLRALLYADCRRGKRGTKTILDTLAVEASRFPRTSPYELRRKLIESELGGIGSASIMEPFGESWEFISMEMREGVEVSVALETVENYLRSAETLPRHVWERVKRKIHEDYREQFGLIVSGYKPSADLADKLQQSSSGVYFDISTDRYDTSVTVLVDASDSDGVLRERLKETRDLLSRLVMQHATNSE